MKFGCVAAVARVAPMRQQAVGFQSHHLVEQILGTSTLDSITDRRSGTRAAPANGLRTG